MGSYSRKRYATESVSFPKSTNSTPASYSYATFADLPASGSTPGNTAFVVATNRLYIWSGVGWYLIATVTNASPTAITGVSDTYALATDGTATTITAVSTDPEGFTLSWSYAVSSGALNGTTVSQADNVFTITPHASNPTTFSITFNVTDGLNGTVSKVGAFTLSFTVTNSRYTISLVKATATGSNQTFDDASTSNHTITVAGNSTASTFSPHRHGGYSLGLDGTNDYITIPQTTETNLTGDFTVEMWVYFNQLKNQGLIGKWSGSGLFGWNLYNTGTSLVFASSSGSGAGTSTNFTQTPAIKEWLHIAVSRTSGSISTYINGTRTTTNAASENCTANTTLTVGSDGSSLSAWSFDGYMRDVRIVNGTGLYTGTSITVPTEPLTAVTNTKFLLGDLPYLKDQSTSNHAITVGGDASLKPFSLFDNGAYSEASHGASAYFDGSGDYLTVPDHADFNMASENFTAECWIYPTGSPNQPIIMGQWSGSYSWALQMSNNSSRHLRFLTNAGSIVDNVSSTVVPLNQWSHVALVRYGNSFVAYLNGTSVVSSTVTTALNNSTDALTIGGGVSGAQPYLGYISDVRVVKGTSGYTSAFTPPTAPLTNSPTYPAIAIGVANSGASAYTLSGAVTGNNTTVNMVIGQTVNFTVNASGHPFYIRVSNGGSNVSTPAATGQGATSGVVSWTPNTAGTYYYQCGNHAAMVGTIVVTASANNVKFLLNPETSISDLSQSSKIKCFGDAATSTSQVKFAGTKSIYGDGSGDYVSIPIEPIGTDDFTVEAWVYPTSMGSYATAISGATIGGGLGVVMRIDRWFIGNNSTNQMFTSAANKFVVNQWQHIAMTREGTSLRLFYNGTLFDSGTNSYNLNQTDYVLYAAYTNGSYLSLGGYIQDFRITKGLARYTATFTPPTAELQG